MDIVGDLYYDPDEDVYKGKFWCNSDEDHQDVNFIANKRQRGTPHTYAIISGGEQIGVGKVLMGLERWVLRVRLEKYPEGVFRVIRNEESGDRNAFHLIRES